jgi:crotonobetainyl-CoA:carnitine CoA-transferase CaiB-like acyl-CoA transferase
VVRGRCWGMPVSVSHRCAITPRLWLIPAARANHPGHGSSEGTAQREIVGAPVRFAGQVPPAVVEVPELGQHAEEVLLENGYSWNDIGTLSADGAI